MNRFIEYQIKFFAWISGIVLIGAIGAFYLFYSIKVSRP